MHPDCLPAHLVDIFADLLARISTTTGPATSLAAALKRFPLALVAALHRRGLDTEAIADVCGMSRRTAQDRLKQARGLQAPERPRTAPCVRGRVLAAMLAASGAGTGDVRRQTLEDRVKVAPDRLSRTLAGMVDEGLLLRGGRGAHTRYRLADRERASAIEGSKSRDHVETRILWLLAHEGASTDEQIARHLGLEPQHVREALESLHSHEHVRRGLDGAWSRQPGSAYRLNPEADRRTALPPNWSLIVFDHLKAVFSTIDGRLSDLLSMRPPERFWLGASTYLIELPAGGQIDAEIDASFRGIVELASELRQRASRHLRAIERWKARTGEPTLRRLTLYIGQWVPESEAGTEPAGESVR